MNIKLVIILVTCFMCFESYAQVFNIGHTSIEFEDDSRNRKVKTEIYYPADKFGENIHIANGAFPVLVFGHGFLIKWNAYSKFWKELVPKGYVICFPDTETGLQVDHKDFALDLKFLASQMQQENTNSLSIFHGALLPKTAVLGHSMGGGASFLAADNNNDIHALVNFAAADTDPSAIDITKNIIVLSLLFSGEDDCVAPPNKHQDIMYSGLKSQCKTHITIIKGGHCYFAESSLACTFGESSCNPTLDISREEQQAITFTFLNPWLDYALKSDKQAFHEFNTALKASTRVKSVQDCHVSSIKENDINMVRSIFPNPTSNHVNILSKSKVSQQYRLFNILGEHVLSGIIDNNQYEIDLSDHPIGVYILIIENKSYKILRK